MGIYWCNVKCSLDYVVTLVNEHEHDGQKSVTINFVLSFWFTSLHWQSIEDFRNFVHANDLYSTLVTRAALGWL